jgi:hypothetical protein
MRTRTSIALALAAASLAVLPVHVRAEVPVRVRVIKGSRQGPAGVDGRLEDLRRQLSAIAYVRWEQVDEKRFELNRGKSAWVTLPNGDDVAITLQERRGETVTIEVALAARNTQSRLTIEKGQRIVHQVSAEKGGSAFFLTVAAWP